MLPPPTIEASWAEVLKEEWTKSYMNKLVSFLAKERLGFKAIYPKKKDVFSAFCQTPFDKVKVVIVGQDPYHGAGQAHGLSFSVPIGISLPPSLKNIFKELETDLKGKFFYKSGNLSSWAKQGVLLLNSTLTVRGGSPGSHNGQGWELFTDAVIKVLCKKNDSLIFVLWGSAAQKKCDFVESNFSKHYVLKASHPSPFSAYRGFFGCSHFSKINNILKTQEKATIDWNVYL